VRSENRGGRD